MSPIHMSSKQEAFLAKATNYFRQDFIVAENAESLVWGLLWASLAVTAISLCVILFAS